MARVFIFRIFISMLMSGDLLFSSLVKPFARYDAIVCSWLFISYRAAEFMPTNLYSFKTISILVGSLEGGIAEWISFTRGRRSHFYPQQTGYVPAVVRDAFWPFCERICCNLHKRLLSSFTHQRDVFNDVINVVRALVGYEASFNYRLSRDQSGMSGSMMYDRFWRLTPPVALLVLIDELTDIKTAPMTELLIFSTSFTSKSVIVSP